MSDYVESLAASKDFEALSDPERAAVLAELSPEAYGQLRRVLQAARALDAGIQAPQDLRARLLARVQEQPKIRFWKRPLPLWQSAAACLIGMALVAGFNKSSVLEVEKPVLRVQYDTVVQEKIVWKERLVPHTVIVYREAAPAEPIALEASRAETSQPDSARAFPLDRIEETQIGTSLADDPTLLDLFSGK